MAKKRNKYYVGKAELMEELRKFKVTMEEDPDGIGTASEELGGMLVKIATRYASKPNFSGYTFKDDFISEAVLRMVKNLHKINLEHPKCNPFSYFTLTCYHVFIFHITKSKKREQAKRDLARSYLLDFGHLNDLDRSKQLTILDEIEDNANGKIGF